jgi:hypothetical protein
MSRSKFPRVHFFHQYEKIIRMMIRFFIITRRGICPNESQFALRYIHREFANKLLKLSILPALPLCENLISIKG